MSINALRTQRQEKVTAFSALVNLVANEKRGYTDEEKTKKDQLKNEIAQIEELIADSEEQERMAARSAEKVTAPVAPEVRVVRDADDNEKGEFRNPFRSLGEQLRDVYLAAVPGAVPSENLQKLQRSMQMRAASGSNETVGADGGFLVAPEYSNQLLEKTFETGLLASRTTDIATASNTLTINALDEQSRVDGSQFGGIQALWEDEAAQMSAKKPTFTQLNYKLKKLTGLWYVTDEQLEDVPAMSGLGSRWFASAFGFKLDDAIFQGNGIGKPLGFLSAPSLVTVSKEGSQAADTLLPQNIFKMYARMPGYLRSGAVWLISQDAEPYLYSLRFDTGDVPLFLPAGSMANQPFATLMGRPVITIEQAKTIGDVGDICFVNLGEYLTTRKAGGGIKSDSSIHVRFEYNETAFRFILRVDGRPLWPTSLTQANGSSLKISPFITLEAR